MSTNTTRRRAPHLIRLGERIATLRKKRGIAQSDLAEAVGVATQSISRIERAVAVPSLDLLARVASTLKVEIADLFSTPRGTTPRPSKAPMVEKIVALTRSKPASIQRQVLQVVRLFLRMR